MDFDNIRVVTFVLAGVVALFWVAALILAAVTIGRNGRASLLVILGCGMNLTSGLISTFGFAHVEGINGWIALVVSTQLISLVGVSLIIRAALAARPAVSRASSSQSTPSAVG